MGNLHNLEKLYLRHNSIITLPKEVSIPHLLHSSPYFFFSSLSIRLSLPLSFIYLFDIIYVGLLTQLIELYLAHNQLEVEQIEKMHTLSKLKELGKLYI